MQLGFYFDQSRCSGCFACVVACKDWNDIGAGPATWRKVVTIEKGKYPDLYVAFLSTACYHCEKPACASVCPVYAITKRDVDGIVVVNSETCLGKGQCGACLEVCPYNAPQFPIEKQGKMEKCHFCLDRLADNRKPACVDACLMRALDAGPMVELREKYGNLDVAEGFVFSDKLVPSVIFRGKRPTRSLTVQKIRIAPAYEPLRP